MKKSERRVLQSAAKRTAATRTILRLLARGDSAAGRRSSIGKSWKNNNSGDQRQVPSRRRRVSRADLIRSLGGRALTACLLILIMWLVDQ